MSSEVLIPKMTRIDKKKRKVKIPLINFVVIIFCTLLIIASTFININLKHYIIPIDLFTNKNLSMENFVFAIPFIPILVIGISVFGLIMVYSASSYQNMGDYIGSTSGIIEYVKNSSDLQFVIVTEKGVADRLKRDYPNKELQKDINMIKIIFLIQQTMDF